MDMKHTPLPWKHTQSERLVINSSGRLIIAKTFNDDDAEFICRAANAYYGLLTICKDMRAAMEACGMTEGSKPGSLFARLTEAIANAEPKQE